MKDFKKGFISGFVLTSLIWVLISTSIQGVMCPKMTQTELFLRIPYSFILKFKEC